MSKALATAATVVGVVAFAASVVASGGATLGLAPGVLALASGVATVATIAAIGLEIGATLLAPKPTSGGSQTTFKADPFAGIPYVMGRTLVGGNIIYRRTYNTPGYSLPDLQSFAVILSGAGPIDGIESFQSDKPTAVYDATNTLIATTDTRVSFDSGGNALGFFNSWMFQTTQLGAQPETGVLRKTYGGTLPPDWTTSSKLSGYAAAMWTLRYDQKGKVYTNGVPVPGWVIRGVKVYDPRLDSTYPGGSGACRAGVEATYVYSENPYLHALTWCIGRYQNGTRILGIGAPIAGIDVPAFVEGANVADANGWKVGGVIYSTDSKWNVLKSILQAGGGEPMHLGAKISCLINTPRVVLDTVTADDIAGEVQVTATQARRDRINAIVGTYRSEAHQWEVIQASPIQVASYITVDGGLRMPAKDYPLVQSLNQMAALARYDIENAREFGPVVLPLKPRWMGYKPGDCIAVTLPESGLAAQPCIVRNRGLDPEGGIVTLTCRSETAAKHPFALGQTGVAPPTPTVTGPPLIPVPADGAWTIAAVGLTAGGLTTPSLVITGAAANVSIDGIVFEYRLYSIGQADDAGWISTGGADVPTTVRKEITALLSGTRYEAAVSYQLGNTTGARRIIGPVTLAAGTGGPPGASVFNLVNRANMTLTPNSARKSGGATSGTTYDGSFVSVESFTGGAFCSFTITAATLAGASGIGNLVVGLNSDPVADNLVASIDYAIHPSSNGNLYYYESGAYGAIASSWAIGDVLAVKYDNASVTYSQNGIVRRTVAAAPGQTLWLDSAFAQIGDAVANIAFGAVGSAGATGATGNTGGVGAAGANGVTTYTWFAYANAPDGTIDFTTGLPGGRAYQGIATNQTTATEGADPAAYVWGAYKGPPNYGLYGTSQAIIAGTTIIKQSGAGDAWDTSAFSDTSFYNGAFVTFRSTGTGGVVCGLTQTPSLTANPTATFANTGFAWYLESTGGYSDIQINGAVIAGMGAWDGAWPFSVEYDGGTGNILFFRNNVLVYTYAWATPGQSFYLGTAFVRNGARLTINGFGPASASGLPGSPGSPGSPGTNGTNGVNGSPGAPGAPGSSAVVQGSADGSSFHDGVTTGDIYARFSNDSGATFGAPVRIKGDQGVPGGGGQITTTGAAIPAYVANGGTRDYIVQVGSATSSGAGSFHAQLIVDGSVYDNSGSVQPYGTDGPAQSYLSGTFTNTGVGRVVQFTLGRSSAGGTFVLDPSQTYLTV